MSSPRTVRKMEREAKKDHGSRTADFICVLGSQSLKINHKTPPPYQQALWKGCTKKFKFKCLKFAKRHWNYDWNSVLWSDETRMEAFGHVQQRHVWPQKTDARKISSYLPSNMAVDHWCFEDVFLPVVQINGIMNSTKYQDILAKNLVASARKLRLGRRWTFQQDNDPKHTSKSTRKWFCENKINVLKGHLSLQT